MIDQLKNLWLKMTKKASKLGDNHLNESSQTTLQQLVYVLIGSYLTSLIASALLIPIIMKPIVAKQSKQALMTTPQRFASLDRPNFRDIRKAVIDRNLFNLDGEYPNESNKNNAQKEEEADFFDESKPCPPTKLKLALRGTIFLGNERLSMATIQESGVDSADIYRAGDFLYGHDDVMIYEVHRNRVILNNSGKRECLEAQNAVASFVQKKNNETSQASGPIILKSAWVEDQLGDGFGKIVSTIRLVPHTDPEGNIKGFRIFKIQKDTLMDRVGFKNGDVITKVNDTILNEQAFVLYEAFLNEKDIVIHLLRNGKTPTTLNVQIK